MAGASAAWGMHGFAVGPADDDQKWYSPISVEEMIWLSYSNKIPRQIVFTIKSETNLA